MVSHSSNSVDFYNMGDGVYQQCVMVTVSDGDGVREK
jgi:hypothetical protein